MVRLLHAITKPSVFSYTARCEDCLTQLHKSSTNLSVYPELQMCGRLLCSVAKAHPIHYVASQVRETKPTRWSLHLQLCEGLCYKSSCSFYTGKKARARKDPTRFELVSRSKRAWNFELETFRPRNRPELFLWSNYLKPDRARKNPSFSKPISS